MKHLKSSTENWNIERGNKNDWCTSS